MQPLPIAVAYGDGIGPEIMEATLAILQAAGAPLAYHVVEIGEKVYQKGVLTGIEPKTWDILRGTRAFLKAPITTPQGGGFKSLNVTVRSGFGLYANIRPVIAYAPCIATKHPKMNLVIIRENEEDLYTGIEYQQTPDVCESLKILSRPGSEKIIRCAFEYAKAHGRKKVSCFTKDNIMKFTDGLFHSIYNQVGAEYPDIEKEHWILDVGAAKLADTPEAFDVLVLSNLYGDILSDIAAQISGSIGLCGSANIGDKGAMFEAIHGSAPRRAGQGIANPSGLLHGALLMLSFLGLDTIAETIHNAWLCTLEAGIHTYDIFQEATSRQKVGTRQFADAVIQHLGKTPTTLAAVHYTQIPLVQQPLSPPPTIERKLVGVDLFFYSTQTAQVFTEKMREKNYGNFELRLITDREARIYPEGQSEAVCIDHWRVRFIAKTITSSLQKEIAALFTQLSEEGLDIIKLEHLYYFDGKPRYSSSEF